MITTNTKIILQPPIDISLFAHLISLIQKINICLSNLIFEFTNNNKNCKYFQVSQSRKKWTQESMAICLCLLFIIFNLSSVTGRVPDEPPIPNVMLTTAPTITTVPTVTDLQTNPCFYAEQDLCYLPRDNDACRDCIPHPIVPNSLVCCNVTDIERSLSCVPNPSADNSTYWINLHIRNATLEELDISNKYWKRLDSLIITDGHINRITNEFTKFSSPQCINISNNNLEVIHPRAFKDLVRLQVLDISHNNLSTIPNLNSIPTNLSLDIR